MSYTPPAYNEVDFRFTGEGYTPPAYNAVNFSFAIEPTTRILTGSTTAFVGRSLAEQTFSIATGSTTYIEHPYRDLTIASGSTASFDTWLRHFTAESSTTLVPRPGMRFAESAGSTLSIAIRDLQTRSFSSSASNTSNFDGVRIHDIKFTVSKSWSVTNFRGGRNYDSALIAFTKTTPQFKSNNIYDLVFSGSGGSAFSPKSRADISAVAEANTQTDASFMSAYGLVSEATVSSGSDFAPSGFSSVRGVYSSASQSSTAFVSSYTYSPVTPYDWSIDAIHARAVQKSVFVLTL